VALKQSPELRERIISSDPHHCSRQCFPRHVWSVRKIHQPAGVRPFSALSSPASGPFDSLHTKHNFLASKHNKKLSMKTYCIEHQSKIRSGLLSLVLGLAILGSADDARAQGLSINTFDTDASGIGWTNWRTTYGDGNYIWDGNQDADGNNSSGSLSVTVNWPTTPDGSWNDKQVALSAGTIHAGHYVEVEAFVKVDRANSTLADDGSYGKFGLTLNGGNAGWQDVGLATLAATDDWQRIRGSLTSITSGTNSNQVVLRFISNGTTSAPRGTVKYYVDNVRLTARPVAVSIAKAPPAGLTCVASVTNDAWQRQRVRTTNNNYSWHTGSGASSTTTYAITVGDFPGADQSGFEAVMYLIPENGISNENNSSADWSSSHVAYFTISSLPDGTGRGNFRYKVNSPSAETLKSTTNHACAKGPLGTWQLSFSNNTDVTISAPDGTNTSLSIDGADADLFQGNLIAYFGVRPASISRVGLSATFSRIKITGAAGVIDDTFVSTGTPYDLDPATWSKAVAPHQDGIFITAPDAMYWVTWPLADNGFTTLYATDDLNQWLSLPVNATGWLNVANKRRLAVVNQSTLNEAFAYIPTKCFFRLYQP
jgi:hypothetical protein